MITINTEKQLIRVDDWATIEGRSGFNGDLDPKQHQLKAIIGRYAFKDKLRCGLSNCHTLHNRGYIVATESGLETNIGKDCGKAHFDVDFNDMSRKFERDVTEKENREALWSFHFRMDDILESIEALRGDERGADWVYKFSRPLIDFNRGVPDKIVRGVRNMLKTGNNTVTVSREATKEEVDDIEALVGRKIPRPHYIEEPVGQVAHLESLYDENNLREILVLDLTTKCKELATLDLDLMTYEQLARWFKWSTTVEVKLHRAEDAIRSGRQLLTVENLSCLREWSVDFDQYLKTLS